MATDALVAFAVTAAGCYGLTRAVPPAKDDSYEAFLAAHVARRQPGTRQVHGHHRAQVLAAFVNALALFGVVAWIVWEAIERLLAPRPIAGGTMLGIALLGLLANLAVLRVLDAGHDTNLNVAAARLHVLGDLLGSIGASIAAVVILLRQLQAGRGQSTAVRGLLYAGVIYLATLLLALAISAG